MGKEIPYFKFYINEWINGDITLEEMEIQGVFINVCCHYWSKDCDINIVNLKKKFRQYEHQIDYLIELDILKIESDKIIIEFLNEQFNSKEVQKITNRINGSLGGRPKKETKQKPNGLFLESETKAKQNPNITNIKKSIEDNIIYEDKSSAFIEFFNRVCNRKFKLNDKLKKSLSARLKEYTIEQIYQAIKTAYQDKYHKETNYQYLTPEYILRVDKLERFINTPVILNAPQIVKQYLDQP